MDNPQPSAPQAERPKSLRITLVRSPLGNTRRHKDTVRALGLQSHIGSTEDGKEPESGDSHVRQWRAFLDEVTAMDFELLITEFDVHDRYFPADIAARDAAVASLARTYLDLT